MTIDKGRTQHIKETEMYNTITHVPPGNLNKEHELKKKHDDFYFLINRKQQLYPVFQNQL